VFKSSPALVPWLACLAPTLLFVGLGVVMIGVAQKNVRYRQYGTYILILAAICVVGAIWTAVTKPR
jgi:hypothetical protein